MQTTDRQILDLLEASQQRNAFSSPLLIFKSEKVAHQGKYFIKVYLFQTDVILDELSEIRFKVTFTTEIIAKSFGFKKVETLENPNVFGCLVELPVEYGANEFGNDYEILLVGYIWNNHLVDFSNSTFERLVLTQASMDPNKRNYLKHTVPLYNVDPWLGAEGWLCACGKINTNEALECKHCKTPLATFKQILAMPHDELEDLLVEEFARRVEGGKPAFDFIKNREDNEQFIRNLMSSEYALSESGIAKFDERIKAHYTTLIENKIQAVKSKEPNWDTNDFTKCMDMHIRKNGLGADYLSQIYTEDDLKSLEYRFHISQKKMGKNRKIVIAAFLTFVVACIVFATVIDPALRYSSAETKIEEGDYLGAIEILEKLGNYSDAPTLLREAKYLNAKVLLEDRKFDDALTIFSDLSQSEYKDSEVMVLETQYQKALHDYKFKRYNIALDIFKKLASSNYKESTKYRSLSELMLIMEGVNRVDKTKTTAITEFRNLSAKVRLLEPNIDVKAQIEIIDNKIMDVVFYDGRYVNDYPSKEDMTLALDLYKKYRPEKADEIFRLEMAIKFNGQYCEMKSYGCGLSNIYINYLQRGYYVCPGTSCTSYDIIDLSRTSFKLATSWDDNWGTVYMKNGVIYIRDSYVTTQLSYEDWN